MKDIRRIMDRPVARLLVWSGLFALLATPFLGWRRGLLAGAAAAAVQLSSMAYGRWASPRPERPAQHPRPWTARLPRGLRRTLPWAVLAAVALSGVFLDSYTLDVATNAGIYVLLALGLNIVVGMAGLLVLGYAAFYAMGAYTYAILGTQAHLSFWLAVPLGGTLAALFGLILGLPTLRLRGDYLAIVTLGFGEITRITLNNWNSLTNGPNGILGIPPPSLFGWSFSQPRDYFYLTLVAVALTAFFSLRLERSRLGRAWVAMREDETAAEAMGVPTLRLKLLAFMLAAFWGGMAGVFFASKQLFVSPESFNFLESVMVLCMVVLGGMGSVPGVILGAVLLAFLPEVLRGADQYRLIVFGAAMVLLMQYRPQGLWPTGRRFVEPGKE